MSERKEEFVVRMYVGDKKLCGILFSESGGFACTNKSALMNMLNKLRQVGIKIEIEEVVAG